MERRHSISRRHFLQISTMLTAGAALPRTARAAEATASAPPAPLVKAALTHGDSRADNVLQALKLIEPDIRRRLAGKKRVVIKPNLVLIDRQLAATHVECVEGAAEFFKSLGVQEIIVGESAASGPTREGYANYGYQALESKYGVRLVDLDEEAFERVHMVDEHFRPRPGRFSKVLLDPEALVVSAAVMKTHDRVVATLGLKNVAAGGLIKDKGLRWGGSVKGESDKGLIHGGRNNEGIHYNLLKFAELRPPDVTIVDGFQGMEGNGPNDGTPVEHKVAVASADWLAADRVAAELMGFDFSKIGYLRLCAESGLGQGDLARIEVLGEKVTEQKRQYRPHEKVEEQYKWISSIYGA
jgi:uncharacterized protein (DUF362 family)